MNLTYPVLEPISPTISHWLRNAKHAGTFFSVISSTFTIYIIISTIDKKNKEYSILQLIVVILGLLNDIDAQLIFDPIFLFPLPCIVRNDPLISIPGSARWHYVIWVGIVTQQAPAFIACYTYRHQAVLQPNSKWRLRPALKNVLLISYCIIILTPTVFLRRSFVTHDIVNDYAQLISDDWSAALKDRMDCTTFELVQPFIQSSSVLHTLSVGIVMTLVFHTFHVLKQSTTLSGKLRQSQRIMTNLLIIQSIFPVMVQVLPNLAGFAVVFMGWKGSLVWPIEMLVLSTDSFFHSIVLLGTTPVYRKRVEKTLGKKSVNANRIIIVAPVR